MPAPAYPAADLLRDLSGDPAPQHPIRPRSVAMDRRPALTALAADPELDAVRRRRSDLRRQPEPAGQDPDVLLRDLDVLLVPDDDGGSHRPRAGAAAEADELHDAGDDVLRRR